MQQYRKHKHSKSHYLDEFEEGFQDEDEGDENWEDLLSIARDVTHQEAALKSHHHYHYQYQPKANPDSPYKVFKVICRTKLYG